MSELKPCPFCGGDAKITGGGLSQENYAVRCDSGHVGLPHSSKSRAIAAWNTRAVPDVPELVRYDLVMLKIGKHRTERTRRIRRVPGGKYVRYNQAAAVIAAKDGYISEIANHLDCDPDCDSILHTIRENEADKDIYKERAEAAEAKLAQYEMQDPVGWMYVNEDGECEQIEYGEPLNDPYITKLYASPAPAADLKAENEKLREALSKSLLTMKRYKNMGYGDEVYMADLCESISLASSALEGDSNA